MFSFLEKLHYWLSVEILKRINDEFGVNSEQFRGILERG